MILEVDILLLDGPDRVGLGVQNKTCLASTHEPFRLGIERLRVYVVLPAQLSRAQIGLDQSQHYLDLLFRCKLVLYHGCISLPRMGFKLYEGMCSPSSGIYTMLIQMIF